MHLRNIMSPKASKSENYFLQKGHKVIYLESFESLYLNRFERYGEGQT